MNQHEELRPDPLIGAALRWAEGEVPVDEVDWDAMRSNIRHRAQLPLARRRALEAASPRWLKALLPVAAAAGLASIVWIGGFGGQESATPGAAPMSIGPASSASIQEALLSDISDQEFRVLVADRNDPDELLMIAASER